MDDLKKIQRAIEQDPEDVGLLYRFSDLLDRHGFSEIDNPGAIAAYLNVPILSGYHIWNILNSFNIDRDHFDAFDKIKPYLIGKDMDGRDRFYIEGEEAVYTVWFGNDQNLEELVTETLGSFDLGYAWRRHDSYARQQNLYEWEFLHTPNIIYDVEEKKFMLGNLEDFYYEKYYLWRSRAGLDEDD